MILSKGALGFGTTVTDMLEVLLVLRSGVLDATLAVLVKVPSTPALKTRTRLAEAVLVRLPKLQVITPFV